MASPQVQQWLDDGSQLRDQMMKELEELEKQRQELERLVGEKKQEASVLARILEGADGKVSVKEPAGAPSFDSKAGGGSVKGGSKDEWHPGM